MENMENQNQESKDLTQGQAVNVLIQAARIAQSKGAYTLEDAELVSRAIKVFVPEGSTQEPLNEEQVKSEGQASTEAASV